MEGMDPGQLLPSARFNRALDFRRLGRLDIETVKALGSSDTDFAYTAPASRSYETWMPVTKFKHGKWKVKWKKDHRPFGVEEDRQVNSESSEPGWNPYNHD